jgi:large subunit ribosomal protein L28
MWLFPTSAFVLSLLEWNSHIAFQLAGLVRASLHPSSLLDMSPPSSTQWAAPRGRMHRAFKGLYGNRMIQFGNKVSFADNKSRRTWKPNVQVKSMYSETLQKMLRFRMTTYVMRCVKKSGGIDEYLVKTKDMELKYPKAIELKREILAIRAELPETAGELPNGEVKKGALAGPRSPSSPSAGSVPSSSGLMDATGDSRRLPGIVSILR